MTRQLVTKLFAARYAEAIWSSCTIRPDSQYDTLPTAEVASA